MPKTRNYRKCKVYLHIFLGYMKPKPTIYFLLTLLCLFLSSTIHAQLTHPVPFRLYKTTQDTITIDELGSLPFQDKMLFTKTDPRDIYWGKLDFTKYASLLSSNPWILQIGYLNKAEIFYRDKSGIQSQILGSFQLNRDFTGQFPFNKNNLIDGRYLYLKFSNSTSRSSLIRKTISFYPEVLSGYLKEHVSKSQTSNRNMSYLFFGGALMGLIMALVYYHTYRKPEYIYYMLY